MTDDVAPPPRWRGRAQPRRPADARMARRRLVAVQPLLTGRAPARRTGAALEAGRGAIREKLRTAAAAFIRF